jgi:hypothetical protein
LVDVHVGSHASSCPLSGSHVRAVVGRINARTSAETLRPESRALASGVRPSVPPYQALIRIPATATASAARGAPPAARVTRTAAIGDPRCCTIPIKQSSPCAADWTGKLTVDHTSVGMRFLRAPIAQRCVGQRRPNGRAPVANRALGQHADDNRTALYAPSSARFTELGMSVSLPRCDLYLACAAHDAFVQSSLDEE